MGRYHGMKNIKLMVIIAGTLIVAFVIICIFIFREEELASVSEQVKVVREMKDYDLTIMGQSVEDKIYDKYDTIKFGRYYQDKSGLKKTPIDWIVLEKREDRVLLLSKYILDSKPIKTYTKEELELYRDHEIYTWEDSTLREWLNNEFYNIVFNSKEKKKVLEVELENENEKSSTIDKVFLLSEREFREYFENGMYYENLKEPQYRSDEEYQDYINAMTVGTDYAFSRGLIDLRNGWKDPEPDSNSFWGGDIEPEIVQPYWLRTPTFLGSPHCCRTETLPYNFEIDQTTPAYYHGYGIRPAIWVSLE